MLANFTGVEFRKTVWKFRKKEKKVTSRPLQNVKIGILGRTRAVTAKKCTKKRDARTRMLFC